MSSDTQHKTATRAGNASRRFQWRWFDTICLFLPFGWLVLLNRHWNAHHGHLRPVAWAGYEQFLFLLPLGFYLAMFLRAVRKRLWTAPLSDSDLVKTELCPICGGSCIDSLMPIRDYGQRWSQELVSVMGQRYFHSEYHGLEKIPTRGPAIILMNHAGMAFPWDFMVLGAKLYSENGHDPSFILRAPGEKAFTRNRIIKYILPEGWTGTLGGVEATYANFEKIIRHGQLSLYAPEGAGGMGKGWHKRYQLQRFHTSFLRLAARYNVPLVPVICIGNEWLHPYSYNVNWLARLLRFPFFGISPFSIWLLLFPAMLPWSLSAKMRYYVLDPVELPQRDYSQFTDSDWQALADRFKDDMQKKMEEFLGE